jgi:hypothetical protein
LVRYLLLYCKVLEAKCACYVYFVFYFKKNTNIIKKRYAKMEVILDIKNVPKAMNPTHDNVIIFDGSTWYLTTKQDLMADAYKLLDECKTELEKLKEENQNFKNEVNSQLKIMSNAIKKLYDME